MLCMVYCSSMAVLTHRALGVVRCRNWLAYSEVVKAWTFLANTALAMTTALLVKRGELPLMSQLPIFHTVAAPLLLLWLCAAMRVHVFTQQAHRGPSRTTAAVSRGLSAQAVRRAPQVLNSVLNYMLQFPAPTGAYVQVRRPPRCPHAGGPSGRGALTAAPPPAGGLPRLLLLPRVLALGAGAALAGALRRGDAAVLRGAPVRRAASVRRA